MRCDWLNIVISSDGDQLDCSRHFQCIVKNFCLFWSWKHYTETDENHEWVVWGGVDSSSGVHGKQALEPNDFQEESSLLTAAITILKDLLFQIIIFCLTWSPSRAWWRQESPLWTGALNPSREQQEQDQLEGYVWQQKQQDKADEVDENYAELWEPIYQYKKSFLI